MDTDEEKPLEERLQKAVESVLVEEGDRAYFLVDMRIYEYNENFQTGIEKVIFDEGKNRYHECAFCGTMTLYYHAPLREYLCAECYAKVEK